ncbi:FkbM family methyltransferase [Pseudooceanicola sp. C21-150M6]|uniref:FkbM family methyltransferase n=1 Tax=Pseudooceanicola sp. C21-150M6 TaxID=3434355 RepID=UPI003D7F4B52
MRNFFYRFGIFRFLYRTVFSVRQKTRKILVHLDELRHESGHRQDHLLQEIRETRTLLDQKFARAEGEQNRLREKTKEQADFNYKAQRDFLEDALHSLKQTAQRTVDQQAADFRTDVVALKQEQTEKLDFLFEAQTNAITELRDGMAALKAEMETLRMADARRGDFLHMRQIDFEKSLNESFLKMRQKDQENQAATLTKIQAEIASVATKVAHTTPRQPEKPGYEKLFQGTSPRLRRIPRLKESLHDYEGVIPDSQPFKLWDFDVSYLDRKSLWVQLHELVFRDEYYFSDQADAPLRIIDGGANIGLSTLVFKELYPNSQVIAFEPNPECHAVAERNFTQNNLKDVTLYRAALGAENGRETMYISDVDNMAASLAPRNAVQAQERKKIEVEVLALSDFLDEPTDFLKLDVEGVEAELMASVADKLRNVDTIFCEYHFGEGREGNSLRDIIDILDDNGFDYQIAKSVWFGDHSEYRPISHVGKDYSGVVYAKKRS